MGLLVLVLVRGLLGLEHVEQLVRLRSIDQLPITAATGSTTYLHVWLKGGVLLECRRVERVVRQVLKMRQMVIVRMGYTRRAPADPGEEGR